MYPETGLRTKPVFRNPELYQVLPWRDWMRENLPSAYEGMVVVDLDVVALRYGPLANGARYGNFHLIEIKTGSGRITRGQTETFGLMDELMRRADPHQRHYKGFCLIDWNPPNYSVNGHPVSEDDLIRFLRGEIEMDSAKFGNMSGLPETR